MADIKLFGLSGTTNPADTDKLAVGTATTTAKNITLGSFYNLIGIKTTSVQSLSPFYSPDGDFVSGGGLVAYTPSTATIMYSCIFTHGAPGNFEIGTGIIVPRTQVGSKFIVWDSKHDGFSLATVLGVTPLRFELKDAWSGGGGETEFVISTTLIR